MRSAVDQPVRSAVSSTDAGVSLKFGQAGNAVRYCTAGWSGPEDGETWCLGSSSTMVLPPALQVIPHVLVMEMRPNVRELDVTSQRLVICVNGVTIGSFNLTLPTQTVRACIIPAEALVAGGPLVIGFQTPDAAYGPHGDARMLAVAFCSLQLFPDTFALAGSDEPATKDFCPATFSQQIPVSQLMLEFESLGQNCEFGFVQRFCRTEPNDLLRFASAPLPSLLAALQAGFAGMGRPETVQIDLSDDGSEFKISDLNYGFWHHAMVMAGQKTPNVMLRRELRRLPTLASKLLRDIQLGRKIFVFKGMEPLDEEVVFPLAAHLRRHGPAPLLFVSLADARHQAGTVERRWPGFLVGYLERYAPGDHADDLLLDQWIQICREALRLCLQESCSNAFNSRAPRGHPGPCGETAAHGCP
jgi:hypothetical protein